MSASAETEITARAYGVRFRVRVDDPSMLPTLASRLPPGARACKPSGNESFCCSVETRESVTGQRGMWRVSVEHDAQSYMSDAGQALDAFESQVRFEVARRTPRWTFVHAGVVGWRNQAIVIPGRSYSGKSTLVRALVGAGATYYSDEFAVLDQRGLVYPFAQPLMHRSDTGTRARVTTDEMGGHQGTGALPVGLVVVTSFEPGATWNPRAQTPGEGLLAMLANSVRAQTAPARVMRALARVAETACILESPRGEAGNTAATLLGRDAAWPLRGRSIA